MHKIGCISFTVRIKRHTGTETAMDAEAVATADRDDSSCRRDAGA